ncbi:ATP-binding protein [Phenylobacterium deserti]|uniref:histidine kinase n=1 Tax=Phenylobacterium deserti TaxID=1914756 RepID=A0A328AV97_9CAUL|nr:ATP-binding protein [Phenylobacterium deserti]RAK57484.1 sensor histidine kinase [Phenylobacterium deserti]
MGLIGRSMLVVAAILALQLAASLSFYALIDREALREDHARRVAELLVVSRRVHAEGGPADVGQLMTTSYLEARVLHAPPRLPDETDSAANAIRQAMVRWEPTLEHAQLSLWTRPDRTGHIDLLGVMRLDERTWLSFRSRDDAKVWPLALRVGLTTVLFAVLCLGFSFFVLRQLGRPLRRLTDAAAEIGHRGRVAVAVEGSAELRELGRAFNDMQDRIAGLIEDQARAMEAVSHDLRTPLARLQLAADFVEPADSREMIEANVRELDGMLNSLSAYLRAQHQPSAVEIVDLPALIRSVADRWGAAATYDGPESLAASVHRSALEEALRRLLENGVRYGGQVHISLRDRAAGPEIHIRDEGPGMSEADLAHIFEPFFRADYARARDTAGFGLGIPTAARLLRRFGGDLFFANAPQGGLLAIVRPPLER